MSKIAPMSAGEEPPSRLLGIFAHPDDEVFCVGGTFAAAAESGAETMVLSLTKGEAGQISHADIATRASLGAVRNAELEASCRILGAAQTRCLDFADGQLEHTERSRLVEEAVRSIRWFRPDTVYSFDETGAYGHPDHIVSCEVALEACALAGDPDAFPDAGEPFTPRELLQARFPQNDRLLLGCLVDWLTSLADRFRGSDAFVNALLMFADGTSMLGYASDHMDIEWFPTGSFIIEQGAPAASLYLVLSGSVDVIEESNDGSRRTVGRAGVGEFVGEVGIAIDSVRGAHCVAAENTACFVLSPAARALHAAHDAAPNIDTPAPSELGEASRTTLIERDVTRFCATKLAALAAHRSQYCVAPGLFPDEMVSELLGVEYFFRAWSSSTISEEQSRG